MIVVTLYMLIRFYVHIWEWNPYPLVGCSIKPQSGSISSEVCVVMLMIANYLPLLHVLSTNDVSVKQIKIACLLRMTSVS